MDIEQTTDYRQYVGATEAELGFGQTVVSSRVHNYETDEGQHIGVFVAEPKHYNGSTLIMPAQHEYRNEPLVMRRAEIMAHHTGSRVAVVEMPGTVGLVYPDSTQPAGYSIYDSTEKLEGGQQTPRQLKAAIQGDFSEHAGLQLDAVSDVLKLNNDVSLILFGESMGAATATEMVRHIGQRGMQLDRIVLHEVVNPSEKRSIPWLIPLLGKLVGIESRRRDTYLTENAEIGHPMVAFEQSSNANKRLDSARKSLSQQALGGLANGLGMRTGVEASLLSALKEFGSRAPSVVLTRGANSAVAHAVEYESFADELQANGVHTTNVAYEDASGEKPLGHFFLFSHARQADFTKDLTSWL